MTAATTAGPARRATASQRPVARWEHLAALLPLEDLTHAADEHRLQPAVTVTAPGGEDLLVRPDPYDASARTLYRTRRGNVLLTGRKGVGKTTFVRELARRAAMGEIPFLSGRRFVWIDCRNVGPEDSRACLESIFTAVTELVSSASSPPSPRPSPPMWVGDGKGSPTRGRGGRIPPADPVPEGIVLCLDGLAALLKRPHGGTNKPLLRAMLGCTTKGTKVTNQGRGQVGEPRAVRGGLRMIGVMSDWDYADLIGGDADMLDLFTRIEIEEPNEETALAIARQHGGELSREFGLEVDDHVVERAVTMASTFILNECHAAKSINLLRQVCEDADYERTQAPPRSPRGRGEDGARGPRGRAEDFDRNGAREPRAVGGEEFDGDGAREPRAVRRVRVEDIVRAVAEKTGIPPETIAGEQRECDFEAALRDAVVGQEQAIREVANELRLIKAGLTEPDKPAAVLLFAGMTGVGKTELAKRVAELYSTSRRLQVYTMGNFTEQHSVSGIIGVPPGYVGHEEGGRLINELNADPYSVFLLDEAEKCHPNIWKPFLNLFDEGWIVKGG